MDDFNFIYPVEGLEIRQNGAGGTLRGRFPYGSTATLRDRGRVRKERFDPEAFEFSIEDPEREIHLLRGHSFDQPLASKQAGTLRLNDTRAALEFEADVLPEASRPSWVQDTVLAVSAGLIRGVSPGFRVPPPDAVPDAERIEPEPGNPDVSIRVIRAAVLFELSLVSRPAYQDAEVQLRHRVEGETPGRRRLWL